MGILIIMMTATTAVVVTMMTIEGRLQWYSSASKSRRHGKDVRGQLDYPHIPHVEIALQPESL